LRSSGVRISACVRNIVGEQFGQRAEVRTDTAARHLRHMC
jgi:hypothetical protein